MQHYLLFGQCLFLIADYICKCHARQTVKYFFSPGLSFAPIKCHLLSFDPGWGTEGTPTCWVCIAGSFLLRQVTTYAVDVLTV